MPDYIEREKIKKAIIEWASLLTNPKCLDKDATLDIIRLFPSADVIEKNDVERRVDKMITRSECLDIAKEIVCKDREGTYGKPEDNFKLIADLWSAYKGVEFTSHDVAMMMILLKIARISAGKYKSDNYIDIAGYAACAAENEVKREENE